MSRLNEAVSLLSKITQDIDTEIERVTDSIKRSEVRRTRKLNTEQLDEAARYTSHLLKIRGSLREASKIIQTGEIRNVRWQKAGRRRR